MFVYIGELCRYLMNAPCGRRSASTQIRACVGNGLRPDIYEAFQKRFGIRAVLEFYGSTEGNAVMVNFDFRPGAIGRIPAWAASRFPMALVAYDVEADTPSARRRRLLPGSAARTRSASCSPKSATIPDIPPPASTATPTPTATERENHARRVRSRAMPGSAPAI